MIIITFLHSCESLEWEEIHITLPGAEKFAAASADAAAQSVETAATQAAAAAESVVDAASNAM